MKTIKNFFRYNFLLNELVKKGIKLKYRRSYLGIVWTLLEPLLTMFVLNFVFSGMFNKGNESYSFLVYILCGRLLYSFFSAATKTCARTIRANSSMIKKVYVPKYLYPLSSVLFNYVIFLISLIVLVGVAIQQKVMPTWHLINTVPLLIELFVLSLGCGMLLATLGVFFRDVEYLWDVALMLIMYTSAIFYDAQKVMSDKADILMLNPLYCIITNFRRAVFGESMHLKMLLYSGGLAVVLLVVGVYVFYKKQDDFILHI